MTVHGAGTGQLAILLFPFLMLLAGTHDVLTARIPNVLVAVIALLFIPFAWLTQQPVWMIGTNLLTGFTLLVVGYPLFAFRLVGGGDAKLLAAAGLWLGFPCSILFVGFSVLAGGILAASIGLFYLINFEASIHSSKLEGLFRPLAPSVPYGFALAAGAIVATPFSWWMRVATT